MLYKRYYQSSSNYANFFKPDKGVTVGSFNEFDIMFELSHLYIYLMRFASRRREK